ncbi:tRNA pseudouridine(38-40) synthase TruA [Jannaschia ovalis]|uniref:tRNA pseudouridine synthase A n=1 Tax=Jannaschia ovalis TaxID=3038773 RepID=A0ABY8LDP3_9RHOB|nr:tRNA pseudouridine(38-40) synthase TruA [Jannaschia sp. GRR-S6-38]WGH79437.1 tRNA pseudouridine(38-40) synthase TruA [Jannaschia sp. GRR-S6-38]
MPRYAFRIEYDGGPFAGWQRQDGPASVQQTLEEALRVLEPAMPAIAAAGRTDAGVHATGQVAHAELARDWDPFRLSEAVNHHLRPAPVAITAGARVADGWHARFSAVERRYTYRIVARRAPLVLDRGQAWRVPGPLDADAMRAGAAHLVGRHDFTTFRASICQAASPVKSLDEIAVEALPHPGGQEIRLHLRARSFLHNQVRSIAGTLERVGAGAWPPGRVAEVLAARDRAACGPVAPPDGLCLTGVGYPADPFG